MTNINHVSYQGNVKTVIQNKFVACKPFKVLDNDKSSVFSSWQLKNPLTELEVVFADAEGEYIPGANIYVRPFLDAPSWIKDVFTLNGKEIILIPKDFIVGYKFLEEVKIPTPTSAPAVIPWVQFPTYPTDGVFGASSSTITWITDQANAGGMKYQVSGAMALTATTLMDITNK